MKRTQTPAGGPVGDLFAYSTAVRVGDHVWCSGATGYDAEGALAGPGVYEQARQALANIETALASVGAGIADVVATRMYVLEAKAWRDIGRAHGEVFRDVKPAATLVEVRSLLRPEMLVEIEVEAWVAETPQS